MAEPGGQNRTPKVRVRTAQQMARQERVFGMSVVEGKTIREIAAELGIDKSTVNDDLRLESERRSEELGERRALELARSIAFYERVAQRALTRAQVSDEILEQIRDGVDCEKKVTDRSFEAALKARERIDKLLGLDSPVRIDVGVQRLVGAFEPPEMLALPDAEPDD